MSRLWRRSYHPAWSQRPRFIFSRGPLAWWTFDEASGNPFDSTNNHYDGTLVGTPTYEAGHLGNALRLSGAGGGSAEYVSFGVHAEFLAVSAPRTYAGWVKFGTLTGQHAILSNIEASGDFQGFLIEQNNGTLRVYCDSSAPQLTVSNVILNTTDWVHITVVLDAGVIRVYRNGSRIGSDGAYTSVSVASPTPKPLTLGHQTDITNRDLNGAVDDWRIYDYALNDAAVAALAGLEPGDTAGTIAGAATVIGVGAAVQEAAAGSAAGVATVSGAGASVQASVGASQGSALVVGAGSGVAAGVGSSSGIATVNGVGARSAAGVGSAAGMATVAGVGASIQASVGTSQGSALAVGAAAGGAASIGSSTGIATVTGIGARSAAGVGTASGVATVAGVGVRSAAGVGSATGMASVTGVGAWTTAVAGTAQGSASVSGATTAAGVSQAAGTAAGVASVAGVGARIAAVQGSAAGVASVTGIGAWSQVTAAQGTAVGIATVTGATVTGAIGDPDLAHPIHASLVMFVGSHPTGAAELAHERVANGLFTTFGTANFNANHPSVGGWKCLSTTDAVSGAWTPLTTQFRQITGDFTLWFDLIPNTLTSSSHLLCVPWDNSSAWSVPYTVFDYLRQTTTDRARWQMKPPSLVYAGTTGTSFPTTGRHRYWVKRTGTTLVFGVDGAVVETITGISGTAPDWASQTSNRIVLSHRKPLATTAEGFGATFLRSMAWNRALSNAELAQLNADPLLGLILTTATAASAAGTAQGQANVFGATAITTAPSFTSSGHYGGASFGETGFGESRFVVPGTAAIGDGTAQGIAAVSGIGARIAAAAGTCIVPAALVAGATTTIKSTAGTATGVATVAGVGARQSATTGAAAGSATIAGVGASIQAAIGAAAGTATAQGNTATTGTAVATAAGVATVLGIGPTLRTQAELRGVVIGAGMRNWSVFSSTPGLQTLVEREYNGLTPGTAFKWDVIEPSQGVFNFTEADQFVAWADARDLPLRLGTLVSHNNLPSWVPGALVPGSGNWQSIITTHVAGVLGHYPNRPWDIEVVSDAFHHGDGLVGGFRNTLWYQAAAASASGPDYIAHAFQQARIAEPFAQLFLSDFGVERTGEDLKRSDILAALEGWLDQNVPINGFSIQGHLDPTVQIDVPAFRAFLRGLAELGLAMAISEFDFRGIAALGLSDPAAFAALSAQAKLFLEIVVDEGVTQVPPSITTWGVSPEDWEATGTEQIPAVPFGTSPGFATNPIFDAIELALEGVSGRIEGVATVVGRSSYGVTGSAQGVATVISIGGQIQDTEGTAEGVAAVEGEAAVFGSADGTATGTATVAGQGEREAAALATAAGIATVAGVGARTTAVAGSAIGIAVVNGTGARVATVAGTAAGVATVFGISEQGSTRGESISTSQVVGQGARIAATAGAAQGVGAVAGVAAAGQAAAGTAAGIATVAGAGARTAASAGSATGVAAVAGITELGSAIGTSAGVATVVGRGAWIAATTGAASGVASVVGIGAKTIGAAGTASGTVNVAGEGARIAAAVGTAQGTATVSAITEQGSTIGQATGTSLAIGLGARIGGAVATASGSAQAQANGAWIAATVGTAHGSATVTAASMPEPFVPLPGVIWSVDQAMPAVTWGKGEPGPVKWPRAA